MLRHKIISKDEPFSAGFVVNQLESDDKQNELLDDRHRIAGKLMIINRHLCRAVDICVVPIGAVTRYECKGTNSQRYGEFHIV